MRTFGVQAAVAALFFFDLGSSVGANEGVPVPIVVRPAQFAVTAAIRDLATNARVSLRSSVPPHAPVQLNANVVSTQETAPWEDPLLWTSPRPVGKMAPPLITFDGMSSQDNKEVYGFDVLPSDATGDIGPSHYVQTVNLLYQVFDRTGTPLIPPLKYTTLFASVGGPGATYDDGDPVVRYDAMADRWVISAFVLQPWLDGSGPAHQVIAVSKTPDPTGEFYAYDFPMPNEYLNDYPKIGIWPDGYYFSANQFAVDGSFVAASVYVFNRAKLLAGDPNAEMVFYSLEELEGVHYGLLPGDLDGAPPEPGSVATYISLASPEFSEAPEDPDADEREMELARSAAAAGATDPENPAGEADYGLRLFEFVPSFSDPALSTFTETGVIQTAPFAIQGVEWGIPQRGTSVRLDPISELVMNRLQFRHFNDHDSLVLNHTVFTDASGTAGIRYVELRRYPPEGAFFLYDEGTYSPDTESRWMGSAALDWKGNLAIGYSASSRSTYPSIRYAGRLGDEPQGGLNMTEAMLYPGSGSQLGADRWGDYSILSVDPADESTFWYVNQYYSASDASDWHTRIGTFKFANTPVAPKANLRLEVVDDQTGAPIGQAVVTTDSGYWRTTDPDGVSRLRLPPGTYRFDVATEGYQTPDPVQITLADTGSVTREIRLNRLEHSLRLELVPALVFSGSVGGPFDPETRTVTVRNLGSKTAEWNVYWNSSWLEISPERGTLASGASTNLTLRPTASAGALPAQSYDDLIVIVNDAGGPALERPVQLMVTRDAGAIQFESEAILADNDAGVLTLNITRTGGSDGSVQVDIATQDGSGAAGTDYEPLNRTIAFLDGEENRQVSIRLLPGAPPSKSFQVHLSNPRNGAQLGTVAVATVTALKNRGLIAREFFDDDPDWQTEGDWSFGQPTGDADFGGSEDRIPDPSVGPTGENVYGNALGEDYANNIPASQHLTSAPFDCSNYSHVMLYFWRWLGVERSLSDQASVEVSNDGENWTRIWTNTASVVDREWKLVSFDLSAIADGEPTVYVRWGLGPTDTSVAYRGWTIDDVELFGEPAPLRLSGTYSQPGSADVLVWPSRTGQTFTVEIKQALADPFEPLETGIRATPPVNSYTNRLFDSTRFYRIQADQ